MATNPNQQGMTQQGSSYRTQRFSLIGSPQQRDGFSLKDQRFINLYPELITTNLTEGKKYYLKKRPGLNPLDTQTSGLEGRGCHWWKGARYTVFGNTVYKNNVALFTLSTSSGRVGFTDYNGTQDYLVLFDGVNGWVINTSFVATMITDPNFPTPHIATPVFIDGYLLALKANSADIYNCDLEDPFTWNASQFTTAELYPDNLMAIVKNANYVVAVGEDSTEFFWDAGNATGSPLNTNPSAVQQMGTVSTHSVVQTDKEVLFVGRTSSGGHTVWMLDDFKATQIGIEPVCEALDDEGTALNTCEAFVVQSSGHKWYILNLYNKKRTFIYDFYEKMWHEWQYNGTMFNCRDSCDSDTGKPILIGYNDGHTYYLDSDYYTDNGVPITCQATTVKIDFDTINRKFFHRFALIGDSPNGAANIPVSIDWSDDDYSNFYPNPPRTLYFNSTMAGVLRMGTGRRRIYRITYAQPYEFRLEAFEIDVNLGDS